MTEDERKAQIYAEIERLEKKMDEEEKAFAELWAYVEQLDYAYDRHPSYPANGAPDRPAPLPAARVVRRGIRAWLADMCRRTRRRGIE